MSNNSGEQDPMAVLAAAQRQAQDNVIRDRLALIESLAYLKRIHATDDCDRSIREILAKRGAEGVSIPLLRVVHPDVKKEDLDAVVDKLKGDGAAKEEKVGKTPILKAA